MAQPTTQVPNGRQSRLKISGFGMTHKGLVRDKNEDMILTDPTGALWAVSDGMGGYGNGQIASDLVIEHLTTVQSYQNPVERIKEALLRANQVILDRARTGVQKVMGATVVAAAFGDNLLHIVWAGDSRAYLLRDRKLQRMSRDHSVIQDLVDTGAVLPDDAESHPESHIVTRAVGATEDLELDHVSEPLLNKDRVLLCSDGLTRCVDDATIENVLVGRPDPEQATRALVTCAMENGAPDNISAIVVVALRT